jgi:capsular exopolysaccharide synthesis family protein
MTIVSAEHRREDVGIAHPRVPGEVSEEYRTILRRLPWPGTDSLPAVHVIGVTSCCTGEGVSTVAAQLAVTAAASAERKVLLVDSHAAHPSLHAAFGMPPAPGLGETVLDGGELATAVRKSAVANLWVLPAGNVGPAPARIYSSPALEEVVAAMRQDYQFVVFDMPAAVQASAVIGLSRLLDGVLLVVEAERVGGDVLRRTKELLLEADIRLLGAVFNKRRQYVPQWLYRIL